MPWKEWPGVRWEWHAGYYDGPLSGMVVTPDGTRLWADCIEDEYEYRRYRLTRLTPDSQAEQDEMHAAFREHVGHHTDYDPATNRRTVGLNLKPEAEWSKFYDRYKDSPPTPRGEVVGWFRGP